MTALKPAKHVRHVQPRVCATCLFGWLDDGIFSCQRENGFSCEGGDMSQWLTTCDRWKDERQYKEKQGGV